MSSEFNARDPLDAGGEEIGIAPERPREPHDVRIGLRLRHARLDRGLRLRELAEKVGCSESFLSKVENDRVMPSLNMLHRMSGKLGLTIGQLLSEAGEPPEVVSRAGARPAVAIDSPKRGSGIQIERLIPHAANRLLQGSLHVIEPGGGSAGVVRHEGEEAGYIVEGQLELIVGEKTYLLGQDDSYCFRSELPHGYRNPGPGRARLIVINTPPSF